MKTTLKGAFINRGQPLLTKGCFHILLNKVVLISHYLYEVETVANSRHCDPNVLTNDSVATLDPPRISRSYNRIAECPA